MMKSWTEVWAFRTKLYSFLANCLLEWIKEEDKEILTSQFWEDFPLVAANPQLEAGIDQLISCTSRLEKLSTKEALEKVAVEFTELFIGTARPKAPPIESFYFSNKRTIFNEKTVEMKDILNKHGLESTKKDKFPEDHLGLQLLLIAVKSEQLNTLDSDERRTAIKKQISFIDDHLLSWLPGICNDAKEHGQTGFYGGLLELIWGTLLWDKELLEEAAGSPKYVSS